MKYYSEETMKKIRLELEKEVLTWPHSSAKKMFGCPCYKAKNKLFAFLVTHGAVITKLSPPERELISAKHATTSFSAGKKTVEGWLKFSLKDPADLELIIPYIRKSYQASLNQLNQKE